MPTALPNRPSAAKPPMGPRGNARWRRTILAAVVLALVAGGYHLLQRNPSEKPVAQPTKGPGLAAVPSPSLGPAEPPWFKGHADQRAEAQRLGVPVAYEEPTTGMRFVLVAGGAFQMGSENWKGRSDELPRHAVTLSPFYVAIHETTNAQYKKFKSDHSGGFDGATQPAERVSHEDFTAFAEWLSDQGSTKGYRLLTEAEWEYACRAGSRTAYSFGDDEAKLGEYAWFSANSGRQTHPVGEKLPNAWGLYDMHGNVWEWVQDAYESGFYGTAAATQRDPVNKAPSASYRVDRGGSWGLPAWGARSAVRNWSPPGSRGPDLGSRLARPITAR